MSEKMKAAALSAATKGLSRVQAERATANATRNVNAYGQKEEGPSRWQEKKEAKTQMYLKSTEKQATLNQKRCQKCRQPGHWTYECQKPVPETPKVEAGSLYSRDLDADLKKEKGEKGLKKKKKDKSSKRKHKRRKHRSSSSSESSDSESDDSRSHKRKHKKRKHRSSSSESSDFESEDERGKRKRHSRKSNGGR
uniref:protein SREK1IP1-like n=1 Tax=Erigeron canadensis TaxID=72917 RepID=UPI001CB8F2E9|nr:protein SREK1IP1-like [Erigeron canadensis]